MVLAVVLAVVLKVVLREVLGAVLGVVLGGSSTATGTFETEAEVALSTN